MFNYGVQFGDKEITNDDDGTSGRFDLSQTVYFFKEPVGYVQVSVNGYIAMGNNFSKYQPQPLNATGNALVAPFFTDVDTRPPGKSGSVFYREDKTPMLLDRAEREIRSANRYSHFRPSMLFIATWSAVGYYPQHYDKTNTFQAVIAAKDKETHVLLYYSAVGWTSPDTTDGKKFNGLGAPANNLPILGIGDGKGQERLVCGADESAILNVHRASNVGQKGLWIFTASELEPEPEPEPEPPIPEVKGGQQLTTQFPGFDGVLFYSRVYKEIISSEGGEVGSTEEIGMLVSVPEGAISDQQKLNMMVRSIYGGPYYVPDLYEPVSPTYVVDWNQVEMKKGIKMKVDHFAKLDTPEDYENMAFVAFSPNLTEVSHGTKAYLCKLVDSANSLFKHGDQSGELTVFDKEISDDPSLQASIRFRLAKKVRVDPKESKLPKEIIWKDGGNEVQLTGSFSDWKEKVPMEKREDGLFSATVHLGYGEHEYKFIVDGEWKHDPNSLTVEDGRGGHNNKVKVTESNFDDYNRAQTDMMRSSSLYSANFYFGENRINDGKEIVPCALFSVFPDHSFYKTLNRSSVTQGYESFRFTSREESISTFGQVAFDGSDVVSLTYEKLVGWIIAKGRSPPEIRKTEIWQYMSRTTEYLPQIMSIKPPVIKSDFKRGTGDVGEKSLKCTISVSGFTSLIGTDMALWMETYLPDEPTFNLGYLCNALKDVANVYTFGIQLKIPSYILECNKLNYPDKIDRQMAELLQWMLKNVHYTWQDICDALLKIDLPDLEKEIRHKYIKLK